MGHLPDEAFTLHGGCNCQAIRYKISVPPVSDRPVNFYSKSRTAGTFPMTVHCNCNDCRRGTGSILPTYICVPTSMMLASLLQEELDSSNKGFVSSASNFASDAGESRNSHRDKPNDTDPRRGPWLPVEELLAPDNSSGNIKINPHVRFYESGKTTIRSFCGRCGIMIAYLKIPTFEGYPNVYDINLASLDKADLDTEW